MLAGREAQRLAELDGGLAAAQVELAERRQIVDAEMVGVEAHGAQRLLDHAAALAPGVVRCDLILERHRLSPLQRPLNSGFALARKAW